MYLLNTLPNTGEAVKSYGPYIGVAIILGVIFFLLAKKKKDKDNNK